MVDTAYLGELFGLPGQVAVVTGGGGMLCGAVSGALARAGASVAVLDLNLAAAQAVAREIQSRGDQAAAVKADVLNRESLEAALSEVLERYGRIDILVNGAGGNRKQATTSPDLSFFHLPQDGFDTVFGLNLIGTVLPCQVFGAPMAAQGAGVILNVSSISALRPLTNVPAYSSAKAAVVSFTQWLAVHMSRNYSKRIRVNALAPGFCLTDQNRFLLTSEETGNLTERGETILSHTPMGRFGLASDLVGAALWLVSPSASFAHGAVVVVDGGFSAYSGV